MSAGRCCGVLCRDGGAVLARAVILATGGAAALWSRTTNPPGSIGAGMLLARAAGATLADLELVQFHPTAVTGVPGREGFLVSEAVRGEGATLHDAAGERFVDELAPRDQVARAIQGRMLQTGVDSVGLDMRRVDPGRFPNVFSALREAGLDPARSLVPVAPAAHYTIGGVRTDLHARSDVPGLFAVGETSCTGIHGANRLASNSLSECFVFAARAAASALDEPALPEDAIADAGPRQGIADGASSGSPSRETREAMWEHAGIERTREGLETLLDDPYPLARMVAVFALAREESRGVHQRADHPRTDPGLELHHLVAAGEAAPAWETWG